MTARRDNEWIRCGRCGRKLMKGIFPMTSAIEIKCHSCKTINTFVENDYGEVLTENPFED